jgi:hypothetical protein
MYLVILMSTAYIITFSINLCYRSIQMASHRSPNYCVLAMVYHSLHCPC